MAAGPYRYDKIPLGDLKAPVTAEVLDRMQQRIQNLAQSIAAPTTPNVVTVSSDYQVTGTEDVIHVDSRRGPVKVTLLSPSSRNRPLTIKQVNLQGSKTAVNPVTIASRDGSKTIAGLSSFTLGTAGTGTVSITSDGQQHWPDQVVSAPVSQTSEPVVTGIVIKGIDPIKVQGGPTEFVISYEAPAVPPPPPTTPWFAPIFLSGPLGDGSGAEVWIAEWEVDFTGAPPTTTLYFWAQSKTAQTGAVFNIRIGGSAFQALDGTIIGTWTETSATMAPHSLQILVSPPTGTQPVRVTISVQAAAANKIAQVQGVNGTFR